MPAVSGDVSSESEDSESSHADSEDGQAARGPPNAWDLVTLQPPYVFGPIIHECKGLESLNTSAGLWFHMVLNKAAVADAKNLVDG